MTPQRSVVLLAMTFGQSAGEDQPQVDHVLVWTEAPHQ